LDYNNGDFLAHYQWRVMQDSVMFVWKGLFQDDEDGMSENKKIVDAIKDNVSKSLDQLSFLQFMGKFNTSTIMSKYSETNESFNFCGIDVQCKLMHNFDYIKYVRNPLLFRQYEMNQRKKKVLEDINISLHFMR
jgi:hypothetical protein